MTIIVTAIFENYPLIILFLFLCTGILVSLIIENKDQQDPDGSRKLVLVLKSGRFIKRSLKQTDLENFNEIEKYLIKNYGSIQAIEAVILDEFGYLLVFTKESPEDPHVIEGRMQQLQWAQDYTKTFQQWNLY